MQQQVSQFFSQSRPTGILARYHIATERLEPRYESDTLRGLSDTIDSLECKEPSASRHETTLSLGENGKSFTMDLPGAGSAAEVTVGDARL